jgi:hypothetical protein
MPELQEATPEQVTALGELVADHIGGHWQTGWVRETGSISVWCRMGPNTRLMSWYITRDGTLVADNG